MTPRLRAGRRVNKLSRHANTIAGSADATLQHIAHAQFPAHSAHVNCFTPKSEAGVAGNNEQPAQFCQVCQDVFGNAVAEILLVGIPRQVCEGQHGDGWFVGQRERLGVPSKDLIPLTR